MWKILILSLLRILLSMVKTDRPSTTTPLGTVKGYYKQSWKNVQYDVYEGIPYAQPPVEELRFQPPVPLLKWKAVIEAVSQSQRCPQYNTAKNNAEGEEDCLYLNIYVSGVNRNRNEKLPVLFWIHGGGFQYGTVLNSKAKYLMDWNIILVTINYRLGPLGFLSTADRIVPGNMGLKDQNLALRWVSKNIQYFRGDPKRITLAGGSADGASVHYHYLSPMSAGLFQRGISFSGSALNMWAFTPDNSKTTKALATILKCPQSNSSVLVECLKRHSMQQIIYAAQEIVNDSDFPVATFTPVVEITKGGYFINSSPRAIIEKGEVYDVPWITGVVQDEGSFKIIPVIINEEKTEYVNKHWEEVGVYALDFIYNVPKYQWKYLLNLAWKHYLGNESITIKNKDSIRKLARLVGDYVISVNVQRGVKLQSVIMKSPVYFYYYTYTAAYSCMTEFANISKDLGSWVCHGDDTNFVFENDNMSSVTTENDRAMLNKVLNFWYSIISTGVPNLGIPWLDVNSSENFQYMHIDGPRNNQMEVNNNLGDIKFWDSIGI